MGEHWHFHFSFNNSKLAYMRIITFHFSFLAPLSWDYMKIDTPITPMVSTSSPPLHASPCMESHVHVAINFQSLPSSLDSIMTIWELKKEKKKRIKDIFAMTGAAVCHDGNDRAELDTEKDFERNTERIQPCSE